MTVTLFGLFAEIERELISLRTKEGLAAARATGKRLGRPKGKLGRSKLSGKEDEIQRLLTLNVSNVFHCEDHRRRPIDAAPLHPISESDAGKDKRAEFKTVGFCSNAPAGPSSTARGSLAKVRSSTWASAPGLSRRRGLIRLRARSDRPRNRQCSPISQGQSADCPCYRSKVAGEYAGYGESRSCGV